MSIKLLDSFFIARSKASTRKSLSVAAIEFLIHSPLTGNIHTKE
jgi:hypothetical protein